MLHLLFFFFFFFNDTATTEIYTLSLHDALPIYRHLGAKMTVTQVRPVANFPIANAHEIAQSVARQVSQVDGLCAVGENKPWPFLFIRWQADTDCPPKTCLR